MAPVVVAAVALAFRAAFYLFVRNEPWFRIPIVDAAYYDDWARRIAAGDFFSRSEGVFLMNPGYPYFLAGVYKLLGSSVPWAVFIQYLLGAASCAAIYQICLVEFGRRAAVIAGLLAAAYGTSVFYDSMLLTASLINSMNVLALLAMLQAVRTRKDYLLGVAGVLLGASAAARPSIILFLPLAAGWIMWTERRIAVKKVLLLLLPVALLLAPVLVANRNRGGAFALTASSGINFYMGNNPAATGAHSKVRHISHETLLFKRESTKEASRRSGRPLSLLESSGFWFHEGLRFITGSPVAYLGLLWKKWLLFWNRYEIPANLGFPFARDQSGLLRFFPGFGTVAVFGVAGIAYAFSSATPGVILLLLYALSTLASNLLIFVLAEYRHPIVAVLIIFTGYAVHGMWTMLREKRFAGFAMLSCIPLVMAPLVFRSVPYDKTQDPTYFNLALAYSDSGDHDGAIRLLEMDRRRKVDAGLPPDAITLEHLGIEYYEKREISKSLPYFDQARSLNPVDPRFWTNLGNVYASIGRLKDAEACYRQALTSADDYPDAYYWLGILDMATGKDADAAVRLEKSIALGYEAPEDAYYNIGLLRSRKGRLGEAADALEIAARLQPHDARLLVALGDVYVRMRRCDAALARFEEAARHPLDQATVKHISAQRRTCAPSVKSIR